MSEVPLYPRGEVEVMTDAESGYERERGRWGQREQREQ